MGPTSSTFKFLKEFDLEENSLNGLQIKNVYIPEEIISNIFTYLSPSDILNCSSVCKRWFNIAKSNALWHTIYNEKEYPKKAKHLPWYVFYLYFATDNFKNLIENGNGQDGFKNWTIVYNGGDKFRVEKIPVGSDPLPEGIPDFRGKQSCFATSFEISSKYQVVDLKEKNLLKYIIRKYKPALYASEWFAGRFDCGCFYKLNILCNKNHIQPSPTMIPDPVRAYILAASIEKPDPASYSLSVEKKIEQWAGRAWEKVEILSKDYPEDIANIYFCHEGRDTMFWSGHYGSKMAGGVLRFDFDSILPTDDDVSDNEDDLSN
ncbi:unnamed protein product [Ceutorhynchus assimilis]|uniref:F-box protein n=1 Tax=Ceutorhynchus assimilis TaxID=467358 RepID=A0A9N9QS01_9CUCU|nr:unnamed protein product [Ceutorhynchus assimilis]